MTTIENIRQGDTAIFEIDYGVDTDMTGWIFSFVLKKNFSDDVAILQVDTTAGDEPEDDETNGYALLKVPSTLTKELEPSKYYFALKVNKGGAPNVIVTLLPPLNDPKMKISVVEGIVLA